MFDSDYTKVLRINLEKRGAVKDDTFEVVVIL